MSRDPEIRVTNEFCQSETAPLSYWLETWGSHEPARAALLSAARGTPSDWEGPQGLNVCRMV